MTHKNILEVWDITVDDLTDLINDNPSLRGFIMGYLAEHKIRKFLSNDSRISNPRKFDDHDRSNKHDLVATYKGKDYSFEFKSLQTNSIKRLEDGTCQGMFQCDASDRREIVLEDGRSVATTCLKFGDFDIIGVSMFFFNNKWEYAFALNRDLPCSKFKKYPEEIRSQLIKSLIPISMPLEPPFVHDPFILLEKLHKENERSG